MPLFLNNFTSLSLSNINLVIEKFSSCFKKLNFLFALIRESISLDLTSIEIESIKYLVFVVTLYFILA